MIQLKTEKKILDQKIKDLQSDLIDRSDLPKKYESDSGVLTYITPTTVKVKDVHKIFIYFKNVVKLKMTEITDMMNFSISEMKKKMGQKTVDELTKKGYLAIEDKEPYLSFKQKE